MKDCGLISRSNKKAQGSRSAAKLSNSSTSNKGNGTVDRESLDKQTKKTKAMMGSSNSKNSKASQETGSRKGSPKKNKQSPEELRPRRRASQTYFFKYQLARNPLKAEEEDLKLALLASLQQCENEVELDKSPKSDKKSDKANGSETKRPVGRPPKGNSNLIGLDGGKKVPSKKICANSPQNCQRRGSLESSSSTRGSGVKDEDEKLKKKKKKTDHRRDGLLTSCSLQCSQRKNKSDKSRSKVSNSIANNDLASVQNKIKKAKKLLQNKNNASNANITGKYSAMRKFPSNSPTNKSKGAPLLSANKSSTDRSRSKPGPTLSKNPTTASSNTTSRNQFFIPYSPYTPLMKAEALDEDYLKKYKPETEDFLTFICFRSTAPRCLNPTVSETQNGGTDSDVDNCTTPTINNNNHTLNSGNNRIIDTKQVANDHFHSLRQCNSMQNKLTNMNISPTINIDHNSPTNHRRPTRQSPRLASSHKKISENDNSNHHNMGISTACDLSITYEEEMKRASIALEDMAQEINSSDGMNEVAQNSPDCISKLSSSPYKNNKHLVKGLMTREFAGAFADEETIFESISNHKL